MFQIAKGFIEAATGLSISQEMRYVDPNDEETYEEMNVERHKAADELENTLNCVFRFSVVYLILFALFMTSPVDREDKDLKVRHVHLQFTQRMIRSFKRKISETVKAYLET